MAKNPPRPVEAQLTDLAEFTVLAKEVLCELRGLRLITKMLSLSIPHDGPVNRKTGKCAARACWCAE